MCILYVKAVFFPFRSASPFEMFICSPERHRVRQTDRHTVTQTDTHRQRRRLTGFRDVALTELFRAFSINCFHGCLAQFFIFLFLNRLTRCWRQVFIQCHGSGNLQIQPHRTKQCTISAKRFFLLRNDHTVKLQKQQRKWKVEGKQNKQKILTLPHRQHMVSLLETSSSPPASFFFFFSFFLPLHILYYIILYLNCLSVRCFVARICSTNLHIFWIGYFY